MSNEQHNVGESGAPDQLGQEAWESRREADADETNALQSQGWETDGQQAAAWQEAATEPVHNSWQGQPQETWQQPNQTQGATGHSSWEPQQAQGWENSQAGQAQGWENSQAGQTQGWENSQAGQTPVGGWENSAAGQPGWGANQPGHQWNQPNQQPNQQHNQPNQQPWSPNHPPAKKTENPIGGLFSRLFDFEFKAVPASGFIRGVYIAVILAALVAWILQVINGFQWRDGDGLLQLLLGWVRVIAIIGMSRAFLELVAKVTGEQPSDDE